MRRFITILSFLMISGMLTVIAQVKGHSYYALETYIAGQDAEILLEVENDGRLALGQIKYANGEKPIRLFGHRNRQDANTFDLEEHLDNGQWTGNISLSVEDGAVKRGEWRSVTDDDVFPLQVNKVKSFPYNQHRTFFKPATKEDLKGHYISYIRQGKAIKQDRALNINPHGEKSGFFSIELSGNTLMHGNYEQMGDDEFMFTNYFGENPSTISTKVYKDFAEVTILMPGDNPEDMKVEAFYVREENVLEVTDYGYNGLFFVRGRLEDGVPSLIVSRKLLAANKEYSPVEFAPDLKPGRHSIRNVKGRVIDMHIQTIGMDINPVLCLLLEDHTVQILPLTYFVETGIDLLSDPLPNMEDIQKFYCYDPNEKPTSDEEDELGEELSYIWGIDSKGGSHKISLSFDTGDYITNPGENVSGDGYLGMGQTWGIHIIMKGEKNTEISYFGQYWIAQEYNDDGELTIGYRMNEVRNESDGINEMLPCNVEGSFKYKHDDQDWQNIIVTPLEGLKFTPKGKTAKYEYQEAVG